MTESWGKVINLNEYQGNASWDSFDIASSYQELKTALDASGLQEDIKQKKKTLFLEWISTDFRTHWNYQAFTASGEDDYYARLATQDPSFNTIYTDANTLNASWLVLNDINKVWLWSWVDAASQNITDNSQALLKLRKNLIDKAYFPQIALYTQDLKQQFGSDIIPASDYVKMQSFITKFLDPSTQSVTLPWGKKIVFKHKDFSFQKVNGTPIKNLDEHTLWWDTWFGSNLFVPHFTLDTEKTDPEIARLLMTWGAGWWSASWPIHITDKHLKYLPYAYMTAALGNSAQASQKIRQALGLPTVSQETPEEYIAREKEWLDTSIDYSWFEEKFNSLSGDAWVTFTNGKLNPPHALLYFNDYGGWIGGLPWWNNNWVKVSLVQTWDMMQLKILDTTDFINERSINLEPFPINWSSLETLIKNWWWSRNILKAQQSTWLKDITEHLWYLWGSQNLTWFKKDNVQSAWSAWHVFSGDTTKWHMKSERNYADITYLWYPTWEHEYDFYELDHGGDSITVRYSNRSKTMDYTTFAIFVLDKGLLPFNQLEYDTANKVVEKPQVWSVFTNGWRKWISVGTLMTMLKKLPDAVAKKLKKDEELRAAEAEVWFFDKLWFIPGVDKYDAQQNLDNLVRWEIEARKNQLMWLDVESKSATSEKKQWIDEVVKDFKSARFGKKSDMRTIAGDFQYVLELNELYEGNLWVYASQHMWVQKLLWPDHYKTFQEEFHKKYANIRNFPNSSADKRDELIKFELNYIAEVTKKDKELQRVYGTKFFKTIEDYVEEKMWSTAEAVKANAKKRPFNQAYNTAKAQLKKMSSPKFIWFLEVALSKVNDASEKDKINLLILQYYTSWTNHKAIKDNADKLESMWRRYGNPLLKIANNVNAPRIILHLADAVGKPWHKLSNKLTYGGDKKNNGEYIEMHNFSNVVDDEATHTQRLDQTAEWWGNNGSEFMNSIYFWSSSLFSSIGRLWNKKRSIAEDAEYTDLTYFYQYAILGNEWPALSTNDSAHVSSPLYIDGVMNRNWSTFSDIMLSYDATNTSLKNDDAWMLWDNLANKIWNLDTQVSVASGAEKEFLLHFVTKKYIDFFGQKMTWFNDFQLMLINWEGLKAGHLIEEYIYSKKYHKEPNMKRWFTAFANFFRKYARDISSLNKKNGIMSSAFRKLDTASSSDDYYEWKVRKRIQEKTKQARNAA